ncbi:MAG TPA: hypothetical protein VIF64_17265 [Pyrinomonadaceae bacterium]|jgi:hypothetical protein
MLQCFLIGYIDEPKKIDGYLITAKAPAVNYKWGSPLPHLQDRLLVSASIEILLPSPSKPTLLSGVAHVPPLAKRGVKKPEDH